MNLLLSQVAGYAAASAVALVIDVSMLWILVHFFACNFLAAATVSFLAGATVTYAIATRTVFTRHRLDNRKSEFAGFVALGALGLVANAATIFFAVKYLGFHYLIAKGIAAGVTFTCNFTTRRQLFLVRSQTA